MAWTKTATFEDNDTTHATTGFNSVVGSGIATSTASKHGGTYGCGIALSTTEDRYGVFSGLGGVRRAETEFWFDPNSATIPNYITICGMINGATSPYLLSEVVVCKPTGLTTYQYAIRSTTLINSQSNTFTKTLCPTVSPQTDAYHKIRFSTELIPQSNYYNRPGLSVLVSRSALWVDDVLVYGLSKSTWTQGVFPTTDGGISAIRWGGWAGASNSGTIFLDDISWAQNPGDLVIPTSVTAQHGNMLVRARAKDMNKIWTNPAEIIKVEGETPKLNVELTDVGLVSSPSCKVYQGEDDVTTTVMPTGSATVSGNTITSPAMTALESGEVYVVATQYTLDGSIGIKKTQIRVAGPGDEL
jgi:hypothetical protein